MTDPKERNFEGKDGEILRVWKGRLHSAIFAHYDATRFFGRRSNSIGIALLICSAISTSLSGRAMFGFSGVYLDSAMTIFGVLTFGMACVHVFLRDSDRAERHRRIAARYAAINRELEQAMLEFGGSKERDGETLTLLRNRLDSLGEEAPHVPDLIWERAKKTFPYRDSQNKVGPRRTKEEPLGNDGRFPDSSSTH